MSGRSARGEMMRLLLLLAFFAVQATMPSHAEPVTYERLAGKKISLGLTQVRRVKVAEDNNTYTERHVWQFEITPGPNGALKYWRQDQGRWLDWPGHDGGPPNAGSANTALGKVHPNPDGLGTAVWSFENGQLTRLSVETVGTKGRTFVLSFTEDLKTCAFKMNEVGQVGAGAQSWVNPQGKKRWMVGITSQSTTCRISG